MTEPEFRAALQQALPDKVTLGEKLTGSAAPPYGKVYAVVDHRGGGELRRVVRAFECDATWLQVLPKVQERIKQLSVAALSYVLPVLETNLASEAPVHWLMSSCCDGLLSQQLPGDVSAVTSSAALERAEQVLRAVLTALVGLHARQIWHGDVRPQNVGYWDCNGECEYVLMDAAIGPLANWTHRARFDNGQQPYLPPEAESGDQTLREKADVYAAGLCFAEGLGIKWQPGEEMNPSQVADDARRRGMGRELRRLLTALLAKKPDARPSAARALEVLAEVRDAQVRRPWRWLAWGVVVVSALTVAGMLYYSTGVLRDCAQKQQKIDQQRDEIDWLRKQIPTPPPPSISPSLSYACSRLAVWYGDKESSFAALEAEVARIPPDGVQGGARTFLQKWLDCAKGTSDWWVRVIIKAPEGQQLRLTVDVDGRTVIGKFDWPWSDADPATGPKDFDIRWRPDQKIEVLLELKGWTGGFDRNVFEREFVGPLALYEWAQRSAAGGDYQVEIQLVDAHGSALSNVPTCAP